MEALITAKTSGLCFNKDDFMVKDFSVDKFVSNCRKFVSLEAMLDDLHLYHKILCSAMVELINKDHQHFVNLSSNLVGLEKVIKNLSMPLETLKSDIEIAITDIDETLKFSNSQFSNYTTAHKMKIFSQHVLCVLEGLKKIEELNLTYVSMPPPHTDIFERMALDFNIVQFHIQKISGFEKIKSKEVLVKELSHCLTGHLEQLFLQSLSSNDSFTLVKILQIYAVLDKETELEKFYSDNVVSPFMKKVISETNILKLGLSKVYDSVLSFITSPECSSLLDVTRAGTKRTLSLELAPVSGFDMLVNAVLPQIFRCFELISPVHIYAPGDPQLFHVNYTATILFLDRFEHYCLTQASVKRLRKHEAYKRFLSKFNLDVHFEIRFQEIAGKFEDSLKSDLEAFTYLKDKEKGKGDGYLLKASSSLAECVKMCWDDKIFLQPLGHNFFRLTLQLISRFYRSVCSYLKSQNEKSQFTVDAAAIIRDVEEGLIVELRKLFATRICVCLKISKNVIEKAFEESLTWLKDIIPLASKLLIKSLTAECCNNLKFTDIPRLYRKTNREVPTKPSSFVSLVFNGLTQFLEQTDVILSPRNKEFFLREVTNGILVECVIMVKDVLISIKKMEHSLKILKKVKKERGGSATNYNVGSVTDDDKIRQQLAIDIIAIDEKVRSLIGVEACESMKSFKELKDLINTTERKE